MIKSMTGYGRSAYRDALRSVTVEIKSVNHRFGDITLRISRRYSYAEEVIKGIVKEVAQRGKIDVSIQIDSLSENSMSIQLDEGAAREYFDRLTSLKENLGLSGEITVDLLASMPEVLSVAAVDQEEEDITEILKVPVTEALAQLDEMRVREGAELAQDILKRGDIIRRISADIEKRAVDSVEAYGEKLRKRIQEMIGGTLELSEDRILLEAAIFADKANVTEELVRLESHLQQVERIIKTSNQPDGKKLDFLVQEMNREANTIGSKANDVEITSRVVEMKSEIEKIREQVQNIE